MTRNANIISLPRKPKFRAEPPIEIDLVEAYKKMERQWAAFGIEIPKPKNKVGKATPSAIKSDTVEVKPDHQGHTDTVD